MSKEEIDTIGKWSEDKLKLLKKYLEAYTKILRRQSWCRGYYYIDAFAGSGEPLSREEGCIVDGSPRCALSIKHPFTKYVFIEIADWRVEKLKKLQQEFDYLDIEIKQGDCNQILQEEIIPDLPYESNKRALMFLDPFSLDIEWETLEMAAKQGTIEVFINFPIMAVNRTVLVSNIRRLSEKQIERMNRFWGTDEWHRDLYRIGTDLFGKTYIEKIPQTGRSLSNLFRNRLKSVFPEVSTPLIMRNSKNSPLYCLIFAGHKKTGRKIIESIFKRFELLGE